MYKSGDKFEIVQSAYMGEGVQPGDIVEYFGPAAFPSDKGAMFKTKDGQVLFFKIYDDGECTVKPLRTEAEKRGAKFGVTGVVKETGRKISFVSDAIKKNVLGEIVWCVCYENGGTDYYHPSKIRLDHEPEYKEIPFSDASHEQRMNENNLWYGSSPVVQISHFVGSGYAFTYKGSPYIYTDTNNLKIRIPT